MRVESSSIQALAALLSADTRSPAPELRTANTVQVGLQQAQATAGPIEGQEQPPASAASMVRQRPEPAGARIRIDEETNRWVAQLVDKNNEVIRQIPPQELLELVVKFRRLQGLLFDERI